MSHRGRASASKDDVAEFNIGPNNDGSGSTLIVRANTTTTGIQGSNTGAEQRTCGSVGTCSIPSANTPQPDGWATYSGRFTWNGGSGNQSIGFQAISAYQADGTLVTPPVAGNYLDNINLTLKPFLQFTGSSFTYTEGGPQPVIGINVVGVVRADFSVTVAIAPSTTASTGGNLATGGDDYALTTATINIPAGDYGQGQTFNVPLTFNNDTVIENNETLTLSIPTPANPVTAPYVIANTTLCGVPPNRETTITINDNDIDLLTTKTVSTATPLYGTPFTYTVAYTNNTGAPTVAPLTSHNVTTAISDPVPSGLTFSRWACVASGTAGTACPAASGTGAISGNAVLPAGGTITYTVTATLAGRTCDAINNTSTITSPPAGFSEGTAVQTGFTNPTPPGGIANNTDSASVTPQCTDLRISKSNKSTPTDRLDGATDTVTSGLPTTYTLFVENAGPAVNGAVITDTVSSGLTCPSTATVTCTGSNPSICPSATYTVANLTGAGITLGNMPANSSATLTFTCTVN